ncbi:integration host factor subunit alpha [Halomonas jincaotanensis]|uniref:integration host factor subunit alpha n=1 Tax=Halomonas jincaotanensis TaxID=2810616 RepID=UPI0029E7FBEA|nr:integration host factor subunit alpha [Halomonas jincaotanensis]
MMKKSISWLMPSSPSLDSTWVPSCVDNVESYHFENSDGISQRGRPHHEEVNMGALTKAELAEHLHAELGFSKREAKSMVEAFFEEIRACLRENEQVKLSGFGNFDLRDKRERPGRNPKTGEEIPISARRVVTFRPGQKLKSQVDNYQGEAR